MSNKIKLTMGDREVEAELIPVQQASENFNQYLLSDSTIIKMKVVVTDVYRIVGEYDVERNPIYFVKSTNVISVNAPEDLKKKT